MNKSMWKRRLVALLTVVLLISGIMIYTNVSINAEVNETKVIVTKTDIPPGTQITENMLTVHSTASRGIPTNAILKAGDIIGKWTISGYGISKNSYIYEEKIVNQNELPDAGLLELNENEIAVPLLVDLETSLGNSIIPNTHIDLYFKSIVFEENNAKALLGKLAENIRVVAVKNGSASNVFDNEGYENTQTKDSMKGESNTLAKIYIFAVPSELGDLINKAKMLGEVFPIATGKTYESDLETLSSENEVVNYIEESTFTYDKESKEETEE